MSKQRRENSIDVSKEPHVTSLSKQTLAILQNFSMFAPYFVADEDDHLRLFVAGIIIIYELPETERIPEFAIGSISSFMNTCNLFSNDEIMFAFTDKFVQVSDSKSYMRYLYDNKEILPLPKSYDCNSQLFRSYAKYKANFILSTDTMQTLKKAASFMKLTILEVSMVDGRGKLTLRNPDVGFDSTYVYDVDGEGTCEINIQIHNMKFISGEYKVSYDETRVCFTNTAIPLDYIISKSIVVNERKDK